MKTFCFYGSAVATALLIGATAMINGFPVPAIALNGVAALLFLVISMWSAGKYWN